MSHHIYHTEALILGSRASGEGDRLLFCLTRDHGLVIAHARSIREQRSRLRYALQLFSHAYIDIIRGRHGWKLISATPISSFRDLWKEEEKRRIVAGHMQLTRRLVQGEEPHESLFDELLRGYRFVHTLRDKEQLRDTELLLAVRLLSLLGYWGNSPELAPATEKLGYNIEDLARLRQDRSAIISMVKNALDLTHL